MSLPLAQGCSCPNLGTATQRRTRNCVCLEFMKNTYHKNTCIIIAQHIKKTSITAGTSYSADGRLLMFWVFVTYTCKAPWNLDSTGNICISTYHFLIASEGRVLCNFPAPMQPRGKGTNAPLAWRRFCDCHPHRTIQCSKCPIGMVALALEGWVGSSPKSASILVSTVWTLVERCLPANKNCFWTFMQAWSLWK